MRSRVTGITSDGRLILRLPSGRTAIVAPDGEESVPRHRNRAYIDRDQMFGPPPGFEPDYSPTIETGWHGSRAHRNRGVR